MDIAGVLRRVECTGVLLVAEELLRLADRLEVGAFEAGSMVEFGR